MSAVYITRIVGSFAVAVVVTAAADAATASRLLHTFMCVNLV